MMQDKLFSLLMEGQENLKNTEVALAVEAMANQLDSMITKLSSMQTKDLANLVKKVKYDNNIDQANSIQENIGGKIQNALQTIGQLKSELETEVVNLMNGNTSSTEDSSDNDFNNEFNPDNVSDEEEPEENEDQEDEEDEENVKGADSLDDFDEMEREMKK